MLSGESLSINCIYCWRLSDLLAHSSEICTEVQTISSVSSMINGLWLDRSTTDVLSFKKRRNALRFFLWVIEALFSQVRDIDMNRFDRFASQPSRPIRQ